MSSTTGDHGDATVLEDTGRVDREEDARQLAELGYEPRFNREMSLAANFALGFTYLYMVLARPYRHGTAAHGDAVRMR